MRSVGRRTKSWRATLLLLAVTVGCTTPTLRPARLLAEAVPVPPGSQPVTGLSGAVFKGPAQSPVCTRIADVVRFWIVPDDPGRIVSFLERHPPVGFLASTSGSFDEKGTAGWTVVDERPPNWLPMLVFTFAPVGTEVGLRADAISVRKNGICMSGSSAAEP